MSNFNNIQEKLQQFTKKYYTSELIKGLILFLAFGLLYFFITLFIEYFLWLPPKTRSILFYLFVFVELGLLVKFILLPISKLVGLKKGISFTEASKIIGNHFPEVDDKLLNVLQLNQNQQQSELLLASIEQKSATLQPIPFKNAINFNNNRKYIKYLLIPLVIWLFTFLTGNNTLFQDSFSRVVHYQTAYEPPAPFAFIIKNNKLTGVEGAAFELEVETVGTIIPENAQIHFNNENYFLKDKRVGLFLYTFNNIKEPITFYFEANGVQSKNYELNVINTPTVTGFKMYVNYPSYTGKKDRIIENTGNAIIPEGTHITWNINTKATDTLHFISVDTSPFELKSDNSFSITKRLKQSLAYQITTSNRDLTAYEKLNYAIEVIKDEYPKLIVKSDIDSVSRGAIQFAGQLSDDYGLSKLNLVYYPTENRKVVKIEPIKVSHSTFEEFYYIFSPEQLKIVKGKAYEMYFELFDNDAVNGSKSVKSKVFSYYNKTEQEITDAILKEQQENLDELNKTSKKTEKLSKDFEEFSKKLKSKSELNWNDKKEFDQFLKRQKQYQELLEKNTEKLKENLDEQELNTDDKTIKEKKEELKKRIEEAQELQKKDRLLEELKKLSEKLDKEGLQKKLDKLTQRNKQEKRSLERLLEMTKRFFVEKKAVQISKKLDSLSKKQKQQSDKENNKVEDQKLLHKEFEKIQKDFDELNKQNQKLAQPMNFPQTKKDEENIDKLMKKSEDLLEEQDAQENNNNLSNEKEKAKKAAALFQKAAAVKMKQLSKKMQGAMSAMQGESLNENIGDLRAILENLVTFSFEQEQLMLSFKGVNGKHAEFPKKLKKQHLLKAHFEHIDDSLYTLAMRVQKISSKIQKDLTDAHYNIDKSLENIAENRIHQGMSNQQYTMTAVNNLADLLSNVLNSLQNPKMGKGEGKGNSFSLPDIIQKQKGLSEKMKEGMKKGEKPGEKGEKGEKGKKDGEGEKGENGEGGEGNQGEQMTGEQYQIYKEQNALREALKGFIKNKGKNGSGGNKALRQMEELEKLLLDKGFDNRVLERMQQLEHELLKLETAEKEQGEDNKRKSKTNTNEYNSRSIPKIKNKKLYFNTNEILNREPLPLQNIYKKKVQEYFKENSKND